jgi:hypothetical protein
MRFMIVKMQIEMTFMTAGLGAGFEPSLVLLNFTCVGHFPSD